MDRSAQYRMLQATALLTAIFLVTVSPAAGQVGDRDVADIFGGGEGAGNRFEADESDLEKSRYSLKEEGRTAEAEINWRNGLVRFTATALSDDLTNPEGLKMEARDYAYVKAREFLRGVIAGRKGIYERTGEQAGPARKQKVVVDVPPALVRGAKVLEETYDYVEHPEDRNRKMARSQATIALLLYNEDHPQNAILPKMLGDIRDSEEGSGFMIATPHGIVASSGPAPAFTGLIVDARGTGLRPVLAPAILVEGEESSQVHGTLRADREKVARLGIAGWSRSLEEARKRSDRIGDAPLVIKATGLSSERQSSVLVSRADSGKVLAADKAGGFLSQCRVVFVVD